MTASVRVEGKARSDVRFAWLGTLLRTGRHDALGKMVDVWGYCTDHQVYVIPGKVLDQVAEYNSFGWFLVEVGLADHVGNQAFRIRGTEGRIEWLGKLRESAKKGGAANKLRIAANRDSQQGSQLALGNGSESQRLLLQGEPDAKPNVSPLIPTLVLSLETSAESARKPTRAAALGHAEFVARFDTLYREFTGGHKPTWGSKQGAIVKRLLKAHGLAECIRRAEILFASPPSFLTEGTPDLGMLAAFFDRLERPAKPPQRRPSEPARGSTPDHAIVLAKPPVAEDPVGSAEALALVERLKRGLGGSRTADQGSEAPATPPTVQKRHTEAP